MAAKKPPAARSVNDLSRYAGLGMQFAVTLLAFTLLGIWLDSKLGSEPWLLIVGVLVGGIGAFLAILRAVPPTRGGRSTHPSDRPPSDSPPPADP